MATIRDVAADTGYSKETIRHVLSGAADWEASPDVADKVRASAARLGYEYQPRKAAAGAGLGIRMFSGDRDPETGRIGRKALDARVKRNGSDLTSEVLDMLTFAHDNMPRKRTKSKSAR